MSTSLYNWFISPIKHMLVGDDKKTGEYIQVKITSVEADQDTIIFNDLYICDWNEMDTYFVQNHYKEIKTFVKEFK